MPISPKAPLCGAFFVWVLAFGLAPAGLAVADGVRTEPGAYTARVHMVLDGDTVILERPRESVRLIGINAPELGKDGAPDEPLAAAARDRLKALVEGKQVSVHPGVEPRDHYGRLLADLRLPDGRDPQDILVEEGLASVIAIPPNLTGLAARQAGEARARAAGRGLWTDPYFQPRPAAGLDGRRTGYQFVTGTVQRVGRSRQYHYLDLGPHFSVTVPLNDWRYFAGRPEDYRGRRIEVRGWVTRQNDGRLRLRISHPAMLRPLP